VSHMHLVFIYDLITNMWLPDPLIFEGAEVYQLLRDTDTDEKSSIFVILTDGRVLIYDLDLKGKPDNKYWT
jgi:hypothetical protein